MNNVNKVKKIIQTTLFDLLETNQLENIQIIELSNQANISRSSFYRNYRDLISVIADYLYQTLESEYQIEMYHPSWSIIATTAVYQKILDNRRNFEILIKRKCLGVMIEVFYDLTEKYANIKGNSISSYEISLIASSAVSSICAWVEENFSNTPREMAELLFNRTIYRHPQILLNQNTEIVLSTKTMRDSDAYTISNGTSSLELMYKAGKGVYDSIDWNGKIAIVAGKGNNAGDGYVLASLLKENGKDVEILLIEDKYSKDGLFYLNKCKNEDISIKSIDKNYNFDEYSIIVDCIFGTGFKGEVKEPYRSIILNINNSSKYIISVDINSGLNGDNGLLDVAIKSNITLSIGSLKSGLLLNHAKDYIKKLVNIDIGIKPINEDYYLLGVNEAKLCLKDRDNYSNKGTYGYIALIGGSSLYSGAIRLANIASSAMRSGAGVVLLAAPKSITPYIIPNILESTIYPMSDIDGFIKFNKQELDSLIKRCKTIAIGMGLGFSKEVINIVTYLLSFYDGNLVIDADGLNALSHINNDLIKNSKAKVILTPHIKEFSRLTGKEISEIESNPIQIANEYAKENNCIVLLKGPTTIVTNKDKTYLINRGSSGMATAGSGDVLSGIIASLVSFNKGNELLAVATSCYINGVSGEISALENTEISSISSDTAKNLNKSIKLIKSF